MAVNEGKEDANMSTYSMDCENGKLKSYFQKSQKAKKSRAKSLPKSLSDGPAATAAGTATTAGLTYERLPFSSSPRLFSRVIH